MLYELNIQSLKSIIPFIYTLCRSNEIVYYMDKHPIVNPLYQQYCK